MPGGSPHCNESKPRWVSWDAASATKVHWWPWFFRTRVKLMTRELLLIDSEGDPKLPFFLYDPDLMDGSTACGLFHGPFLLAVSTSPHRTKYCWLQSFRFTCVFLYHHLLGLAERCHWSVEMQKFMAWLKQFHQQSVMQPSKYVLTCWASHWNLTVVPFNRLISDCPLLRNGEISGKRSTSNVSTSCSVNNSHSLMTRLSSRPWSGGTSFVVAYPPPPTHSWFIQTGIWQLSQNPR